MTRSRGRPVRPMPVHPERVISRAVKAGLSATIRLQRDICNKNTRKYYDRSRERFSIRQEVYQITKKRGHPDFSYISLIEAPTRTDARIMFYERAAKYGFTEINRQKNSYDTVDSLNQRFNACGAVVRENSEVDFPHPDPIDFGIYTRRDGKGRKQYRRAGYEGSSFGPKVTLAHPDLPSLDFGDTIRSYNEYLATFCAIHDISVRETARYSQLFYLLVRPYLEHLYSEFKCGKANFQKGVNRALRQVKELILNTGYLPTMYEKKTVTKKLEFDTENIKKENRTFFKRKEEEAREFYGAHYAVDEFCRLRGNLGDDEEADDDNIFTVKDAMHIRNQAAKRARIAGSIIHRRISDIFSSPWRLNDVILSGDRYARHSEYIIISEVPVQTSKGAGKVDLILCKRTISDDGKQVFWRPVFVLEIKTRLGQGLYVDANYKESEVRPNGSSLQRVVSDFPLSDYPLSEDLWDTIVKSTPTKSAREQLNIYCQALRENYKDATQQDLGHILRGVVVIESSSDITKIRRMIEQLIIHGYESVKSRVRSLKRTVFAPSECDSNRIALVIDRQPGPNIQDEIISAPWEPTYTPFKVKKKTKRRFLLYLAGHSPTSAGQSAAWNARYYHGIQMLYEMKKSQKNAEFVWLDLASQFNEPQLAETRLRLRPRGYSDEELAKVQPDHIREFFESIKVTGYLDEVLSFLYRDGKVPSFDLKIRKNKRKVIIVTGADTLRDATPSSHREQLSVLIDYLQSSLPGNEKTTIMWFDSPAPTVEKAIPYSTRALIPYYETSPLGEMVTEMIWNLPIAPRGAVQPKKWNLSTIGDAPMHDDIRVIIRHSPTEFHMELVHVPFLRGWSRRFRNKGTGLIIREQEVDDVVPERSVRDRMKLLSLTMLPWLVRLWPQKILDENTTETIKEQVSVLDKQYRGGAESLKIIPAVLPDIPSKPPRLLDLVRFRLPKSMDALSYQKMTAGRINSQRLYRSPRKLQTQPLQEITSPLSTEEVPAIKEELEYEWLFGAKFESEDEDIHSWWMVVQDPARSSRILAGCFIDRPPDKDGFLWAENKQEILTQSSLDGILSSSQTVMIGRRIEEKLELWMSKDGDEPVYAGVFEVKGQGRSTIGNLRAIRQTFTEEPAVRPSSNIHPSESFYRRMVDSLRRQIAAATNPTPIRVHLEMVDDACRVTLQDDEDEVIQEITIEYTTDLISLLRWPMIKGGPMFIDSGEYVTWSIFDDIDYGELDFISPYVTYTAARKAPTEMPKRLSQFFDEAEFLSVSITHDDSICPIALGNGEDHGACWMIELPPDCPARVRKQLGRAMTGEEVNGLLAPGRLFAGRLYTLDFTQPTVSEMDESIAFHEERYIRMFLRSKGLHLKKLPLGTFLQITDQKWVVSIEWEDSYFKWKAQSTATSLSFKGGEQYIELVSTNDIQEESKRLLNTITSQISPAQIYEYSKLEVQVLSGLENRGYSKRGPPCELRFIEQTETICQYGVFLSDDSSSESLLISTIDATETKGPDSVIYGFSEGLASKPLSDYNIRNKDSFLKRISTWVNKYIPEVEEYSEGVSGWIVTLSVDVESGEIHWVAEQDGNGPSMTGEICIDSGELEELEEEKASEEVQRIFKIDVIPQIENIDNLDDVLEEQIPNMVRSIRDG